MKIKVRNGIAATYESITKDCSVFINARQQWEILDLKNDVYEIQRENVVLKLPRATVQELFIGALSL